MPSSTEKVLPADLITHLNEALLDISTHPYPFVPSPPGVPKRASVALIIRIQPHYGHWPPQRGEESGLNEQSQSISTEDRVNSFFRQDWVQHGDPEILFIKRATRKADKWNGHIALPGGRRDPEDADDRAAAVREAWEEVGIDLSDQQAIAIGNLPQLVVTSGWGKIALMTVCPYVFLITAHGIPPLKLQPTEVASAHWVPMRALLSQKQRTYWYQDVSNRTSRHAFGFSRIFHHAMLGDLMFPAVRLIPSESIYCSSIAEFLPVEPIRTKTRPPELQSNTVPLIGSRWNKPTSPVDVPLLLWGLTHGVVSNLLDMLPPHDALQSTRVYPTFTQLDVRFILWVLTFRLRKHNQKVLNDTRKSLPSALGVDEERTGRYFPRILTDLQRPTDDATAAVYREYYQIVRQAVLVSFFTRASVAAVLLYYTWRSLKRSD